MLEDETKFTLKDENGVEKEFYKLFSFDSEETGKSYIAYTDNSLDENGNVIVRANSYDPTGNDLTLLPLETEKEWKVIENILLATQEKIREEMKQGVEDGEGQSN